MKITIFDLNLDIYESITDYLSNGWYDSIVSYGVGTISVTISKYAKFTTTGNGVVLEYMGHSALLDRNEFYYIKID